MPIYEYTCPKCGEFEVTQRITEPSLKKCPTCRSKVKKLISSTSFQLKGSGWYVTDYARKGSGTQSGDSKSESKGKSDSTSESKSDSAKDTSSTSSESKSASKTEKSQAA